MGAWIEIVILSIIGDILESLPTWERGLKYNTKPRHPCAVNVAPYMGAWIEIQVD